MALINHKKFSPLVAKTDLKSLIELTTCVDHANATSYHEGKTMLFYGFDKP